MEKEIRELGMRPQAVTGGHAKLIKKIAMYPIRFVWDKQWLRGALIGAWLMIAVRVDPIGWFGFGFAFALCLANWIYEQERKS